MSNQEHASYIRIDDDEGVSPPPRFLLWLVVGLFLLVVVGGIGVLFFMQGKPTLVTVFDLAVKLAVLVTVVGITGSLVFRKRLPHRLAPGIIVVFIVAWLVGGTAFVLLYQNILPPGQREAAKSVLPFMQMFDPPLPPTNMSLPTPIPGAGGISPSDLLNAPLGLATSIPTAEPATVIQVEPSATPSSTPQPTFTPTSEATELAMSGVDLGQDQNLSVSPGTVLPGASRLFGFTVVKQTWNNCGPANITMALSYYGWTEGQEVAQAYLRPDKEDKNVSPHEIVAFVNEETGVRALTRVGGNMELLKGFLSNNIPVLIETGYMYEGSSWLGHYQTVVGYDDSMGVFYIYDSYLGAGEGGDGLPKTFSDFDKDWAHFNRTFIVIYQQEEESAVRNLLGDWVDVTWASEHAAEVAQTEARNNPQNSYAWNNLGASLTKLGLYEDAAVAFDQARRLGTLPWRITLYQFGQFEAYYNVGRYDEVLALVNSNLNNGGDYIEETYYWQGLVLEVQGDNAKAAESFRRALRHNPRFAAAQDALNALPA